MERIAAGKPPLILGDGWQTMDFVHAADIARANILAAKVEASDEVFNIASGVEVSLRDLAEALLRSMGSHLRPEFGPERKVNPVPRRLADISRTERMIGFRAQISLEDGLRSLVEWWQQQNETVCA